MIEVKHLTKWYGRVLAVDDISFHVDKGVIVGFLGPNGAGKSTTLKILTCYQPATSGTATVDGYDVLGESMEVRRRVGYMPESVPLYPEMRVRELLMFVAALRDVPRGDRKSAVARAAERCWLTQPDDVMRRRVGELSRGYRQRVGLAEAMLHDPPVLVLDEPTIGLDPAQIRAVRDLIRELGQDHTIILSSHILAEVEQTCKHLIIIAGGRIAAAGSPGELRQRVLGPSRIIAEVKADDAATIVPAVNALSGAREVASGRAGSWTRLTIQGDAGADLRSEVFKLAREKGWQMRELRREVGSLEDFFVQITYEQNVRLGQRTAATA
ncbi:MAG TPA: ATP-binding cassette domain-containing protein [Phycisphaerae bacterium]|nr:ATP-binding cassette domain-containing protein [Phycisphaerae bacterium]